MPQPSTAWEVLFMPAIKLYKNISVLFHFLISKKRMQMQETTPQQCQYHSSHGSTAAISLNTFFPPYYIIIKYFFIVY